MDDITPRMSPDLRYFRTVHGIPKLLQILVGVACIVTATIWQGSTTGYFVLFSYLCLAATLFWTIVNGCRVFYVIHCGSWITLEFISNSIIFVLYILALGFHSGVILGWNDTQGVGLASVVILILAIINTLLYGVGCFWAFYLWRALQDADDGDGLNENES